MVNLASILTAAAASSFISLPIAHPGEKHDAAHLRREITARNHWAAVGKRSLGNCAGSLKHRQLMQRSVERRAQKLQALREKRGIETCRFPH